MTDRELLEAAAKVAGLYLEWDGPPDKWQPMYYQGKTYHSFDPLTDDGDALRLAAKLKIPVCFDFEVPVNDDPMTVTRRAIVRAAAAIGAKA